jgi:hypothetical protein
MSTLINFKKSNFELCGISKQGHALTRLTFNTHMLNNETVLVKKRDFNLILVGKIIEGCIVPYNGIYMLKTLQF